MIIYEVELTTCALRDAEVCAHREHGVVYSMFGARQDRLLYRRDGRMVALVGAVAPTGVNIRSCQSVELAVPSDGARIVGALRASPTVCESTIGRRGNIRPILDMRGIREWFNRKMHAAGLAPSDVDVTLQEPTVGYKPGGRQIVHNRADFRFTAAVTDHAALSNAMVNGVGRGKAYGHGLLLVSPCRS